MQDAVVPAQLRVADLRTDVSRPHTPSTSNPPVIGVFCGSSPGINPAHLESARALAHAMHKAGAKLVYGGGNTGLMAEMARTLIGLSGPDAVFGVIPLALIKHEQKGRVMQSEPATSNGSSTPLPALSSAIEQDPTKLLDEQIYGRTTVVPDMHTRKAMMTKHVIEGGPGGGFIALSGGYGTLEELMEVTTWNQIGIHGRGVVVFNVEGYYDGLMQWLDTAVDAGFITTSNKQILRQATAAEECIRILRDYKCSADRMQLDWSHK